MTTIASHLTAAPQIKSRARVRDNAEVFTAPREVNAMLDLLPAGRRKASDGRSRTIPGSLDVDWRFLEPACGHGNFLEAVVVRKLRHLARPSDGGAREHIALRALASTYGIDICPENILEAHDRLRRVCEKYVDEHRLDSERFASSVDEVLRTNIILGDGSTGCLFGSSTPFYLTEYAPDGNRFERRIFRATDVLFPGAAPVAPVRVIPPVHFLDLAAEAVTHVA